MVVDYKGLLVKIEDKKLDKILVENSGYFKNREVRTISGINTFTDTVNIKNHGFFDSEIIKYNALGTINSAVGGLTKGSEYFVKKIDDDNFRLSNDKNLNTFISLTNDGLGTHVFQDPPIYVDISGRQGINTTNASATPIIRGEVKDVHVYDKGSDYGSTVINDNYKATIEVVEGKNVFIQPFIVNGRIDQIIVKFGGENFFSTPDIIISGERCGL